MNTVVENAFLSLCAEPRFTADRRGVQARAVVKEWHRVAYSDRRPQGDPKGTVVCVHGFSRNRYDFDMLTEALSVDDWRVVCPDMPGPGPGRQEGNETSDWLGDQSLYDNSQYMFDCMALIARLGVQQVHWIGTSMAGLLGMLLAAQASTPIRSLVMNDAGPSAVPKAAREHIAADTSADATFEDEETFAAYVREIHQGFEPLTDKQWQHLIEHSRRRRADGTLRLANAELVNRGTRQAAFSISRAIALLLGIGAIVATASAAQGEPPCVPAGQEMRMISRKDADAQKVIEARVDEKTTVVLEENPTTGFVWTLEPVDAATISLEGSDFIPAAGGGLGAGGQRVFTFLPRQAGVVTLNFSLGRPWEDENARPREKVSVTMRIHTESKD